jgi:hypothetical protein
MQAERDDAPKLTASRERQGEKLFLISATGFFQMEAGGFLSNLGLEAGTKTRNPLPDSNHAGDGLWRSAAGNAPFKIAMVFIKDVECGGSEVECFGEVYGKRTESGNVGVIGGIGYAYHSA